MNIVHSTHKALLYEKCFQLLKKSENIEMNAEQLQSLSRKYPQKIQNKWDYSQAGDVSSGSKTSINFLFSLEEFQYELSKNRSSFSRVKEYKKILTTKQKLSLFYGYISTKKLKNFIKEAGKFPGYFSKNFFSLLEQRVDVVLYRSGLVNSILTARQLCLHEKVLLNSQFCISPSTRLKPGDVLSIPSLAGKNTTSIDNFDQKHFLLGRYKKRQLRSFSRCNAYLNSFSLPLQNSNISISYLIQFLLQALKTRTFRRNEILLKSIVSSDIHSVSYPLFQRETTYPFSQKELKRGSKTDISDINDQINDENLRSLLKSNILFALIIKLCSVSPLRKKQLQYYLKKKERNLLGRIEKRIYKPVHLEVSTSTSTIIYLYSPQRIELPFTIDIDTLKKLTRI